MPSLCDGASSFPIELRRRFYRGGGERCVFDSAAESNRSRTSPRVSAGRRRGAKPDDENKARALDWKQVSGAHVRSLRFKLPRLPALSSGVVRRSGRRCWTPVVHWCLINWQMNSVNLKKPGGLRGRSQNLAEDDVTNVGHQGRTRKVLSVPFVTS